MRYYRLSLLKDGKNLSVMVGSTPTTLGPFDTTKTPSYGQHIEFDVLIQGYDTVTSGLVIAIFGLPVEFLREDNNLRGYQFTLSAGFQAGLPLANPDQRGIVMQGTVYTSYANFIGTNQCLILNCITQQFDNVLSSYPIVPIVFNGKEKDKLSDVLLIALKNAYSTEKYPDLIFDIKISDKLILTEDMWGLYEGGLQQLAIAMRSLSKGLYQNISYDGVRMTMQGNKIIVWDNDYKPQNIKVVPIKLQELIGQPSWLSVNTMTFKCQMRADINVSDYIKLDKSPYSTQERIFFSSSSQIFNYARNNLTFSGMFQIRSVRHVGQYQNPDANNAWVTIYEANLIAENK